MSWRFVGERLGKEERAFYTPVSGPICTASDKSFRIETLLATQDKIRLLLIVLILPFAPCPKPPPFEFCSPCLLNASPTLSLSSSCSEEVPLTVRLSRTPNADILLPNEIRREGDCEVVRSATTAMFLG